MGYREALGPLVVEEFSSLAEAIRQGEFAWTTATTFISGPVGCVYQRDGGGHTGLPGAVEVPLDIAYLFAAAPDLLAALERWIELFAPVEVAGTEGADLLAQSRAAVRRARGESEDRS